MATLTATARISVEGECSYECWTWAAPLHAQLSAGAYDVCSVLKLPAAVEQWEEVHRTARKRARRAERLGYHFSPVRRHEHAADIAAINLSLPHRQGRPMTNGYRQPPSEEPDPEYPCPRHGVHPYGVLRGDTLVAYLWVYRAGELALVSQILGHGEHLGADVMYLLVRGALAAELREPGYLVYNRHDSGTDGLRYFKERLGFWPAEVTWAA